MVVLPIKIMDNEKFKFIRIIIKAKSGNEAKRVYISKQNLDFIRSN